MTMSKWFCSVKSTDNYQLNQWLHLALRSFSVSFSSLFICLVRCLAVLVLSHRSHSTFIYYHICPHRASQSAIKASTSCFRRFLRGRTWHIVSSTESLLLIVDIDHGNDIISSPFFHFVPDVFAVWLSAALYSVCQVVCSEWGAL